VPILLRGVLNALSIPIEQPDTGFAYPAANLISGDDVDDEVNHEKTARERLGAV